MDGNSNQEGQTSAVPVTEIPVEDQVAVKKSDFTHVNRLMELANKILGMGNKPEPEAPPEQSQPQPSPVDLPKVPVVAPVDPNKSQTS